ncbi:MAG: extracellular solute-binding protein [Lachnospiraceae bacterium]|nr:extracellular solute-binding protein [Lachnospiraceae bacterium]MBR1875543.1 extracellular solute-binding protein [Lachnospiraceae bacterium]
MKKKIVSVLLTATMAVSLLAGCGSSAAPAADTGAAPAEEAAEAPAEDAAPAEEAADSGEAADSAAASGDNSLTVWAWDANFNIPALQAAADDYKANVDDTFVLNIEEQSQSSDVENAITLAGSSGDYSQLPDIVLFQDHYIQRYVADYPDAWVDVDDADVDWSDFGEEKLSYSTIGGKHYGFPVDNGTAIFAYRVDLLEEAGYTIDDMTDCTWEKFIEVGEKVYEKTGKYLLSMDGDGNDLFYLMLQAEGQSQFKDGQPYITENETLVEIVNIIHEMCEKNVCYLANDWSDYTDQTIMGDMVAGVMNGNWIIPTIRQVAENSGKWEITNIPTIKGGGGYAANGGSSLYVTSNCKNPELAKKFLAYTFGGSTETYDNALRNGGVVTCCISAGKSDVYNEGVEYFNNTPIYAQIVEMGGHVPVVEQSDFHYTARQYLAAAMININNGADVMSELQNAEDQLKFEMEGAAQ